MTIDSQLDSAFAAYVESNPEVVESFVNLAFQARNAGKRRIGAKLLVELLRWNSIVDPTAPKFRIPNSYTSRLARLAMAREPQLKGLFNVSKLRNNTRTNS